MADPNVASGNENQEEEQLSVSDFSRHGEKYPFIEEFSDLLASLSTKALQHLATHQQRLLAKAVWEAENYGGSRDKCRSHLKELYGPAWNSVTTLDEHFREEREYLEWVILLDHVRQCDKSKKLAMLRENTAFKRD